MSFPLHRYRRLRRSESLRSIVRETSLAPSDFIAPLFVVPGAGVRQPVPSMPGIDRVSPELAAKDAKALASLGVLSVILFGIPEEKDAKGTSSADPEGPVCRAVRAIKAESPKTVVMTDVCLCEYTDHGHCGVIAHETVDNDATLPILAAEALAHAKAGADVVAPSDMMDGRVGAIRAALDESGFRDVALLAYAAKYASGFYGPFREAAESTPSFGDRRAYQMDPANVREAIKEVALRRRGRRGPRHGQARALVPRRRARRQGGHERARRLLQRLRRVRDGEGRRPERLDRRQARHARDPDVDEARGGGFDPHVSREGSGASGGEEGSR